MAPAEDRTRHIPFGEGVDLIRQMLTNSPLAMVIIRRDCPPMATRRGPAVAW